MKFYRDYPKPSDRMGCLWAVNGIQDACILEFGPAGTTHFSIEGLMQFGEDIQTKTFTTHMDETDVTFGNEERLVEGILEIDQVEKPKVLFVMGSSLTSIIGMDIESIVKSLEDQVNCQLIVLPNCDFRKDFRQGIQETLQILVKEIVVPTEIKRPRFNILGLGLHDFNHPSDLKEIQRLMQLHFGMVLGTTFTLNTSLEAIEKAGESQVNLVLGEEGLLAAEMLEKDFGQPFVYGKPYGVEQTDKWLKELAQVLGLDYQGDKEASEHQRIRMEEKMLMRQIKNLKNKRVYLHEGFGPLPALKHYLDYLGFQWAETADQAVLRFDNGVEARGHLKAIQVSHPSFNQKKSYPYTPMVGYRGAYYLCQEMYNRL